MNKDAFERLSRMRAEEAKILLESGEFAGAYYLMGYAVECALKACICKQVREFDFPDKELVNKAYTHDLEKLVNVAGLEAAFEGERESNPLLARNWTIVKEWNESTRYSLTISVLKAKRFYIACALEDGILPWIEKQW